MSGVAVGVLTVIYVTLLASEYVRYVIGETGLEVVTRPFGLLLAGIAVDLMATGIGETTLEKIPL